MTTLTRLTIPLRPELMAEFRSFYAVDLAPLLRQRGWVESDEPVRRTAPGLFCQTFAAAESVAVPAPADLSRAPAWRQAVARAERTFARPDGADGLSLRWQVIRARDRGGTPVSPQTSRSPVGPGRRVPAGPGRRIRAGSGVPQGLWRTLDVGHGLPSSAVVAIHPAAAGDLWLAVGFSSGVCRFDGAEFQLLTTEDGLPSNAVRSIAEDERGRLWFATGAGACRFDGHELWILGAGDGLLDDAVDAIAAAPDGSLWFGSAGGVTRLHEGTLTRFRTGDPPLRVRAAACGPQGEVWLGTDGGGVLRCGGDAFAAYRAADGLAADTVTAVYADRQGRMWFGTGRYGLGEESRQEGAGVTCCDGGVLETFSTVDGLGSDTVTAIAEDESGDLWLGTFGGGASRWDGSAFTSYTVDDGLADDAVTAIANDREGNLWFGTGAYAVAGGGVSLYLGGRIAHFTTADGLASNNVTRVCADSRGDLWAATWRGVCRWDGRRFAALEGVEGNVRAVAEDAHGHLWFGLLHGGGAYRYDGARVEAVTPGDGLPASNVWEIVRGTDGCLWLGTLGGGACRYDGRSFTTFTTADGLAHNSVQAIVEDRRQCLWIGTYGGGVSRFDGRLFQTLHRWNGLAHNGVLDLHEDPSGAVWIATDGGGLTRYRPGSRPPVLRVEPAAGLQQGDVPGRVTLIGAEGTAAFELRGASFRTGREQLAYAYRLHGHDADWRTSRSGQISYADLELGEYRLEAHAVDLDLNYSEAVEVRLDVAPDPRLAALSEALSQAGAGDEFVGNSRALRRVQEQLARVAGTDLTVLVLGETGTGKGLAARSVHALSERRSGPFIQVNCGALPTSLVDSELFGHERGSFTGAHARRLGRVELAAGGTLFLDEIGDMSPESQARLLRLLEEGTYERVGGGEVLQANARVVVATNRDLEEMVRQGAFRQDLYFRLHVFPVLLPPLRERREDVPLLAAYFMRRTAAHLGRRVERLDDGALASLEACDWPGNVRELEHAIQRAVLLCTGTVIRAADLGVAPPAVAGRAEPLSLEEHERRYILEVLERTGWRVKGPHGAAAALGLPDSTLRGRMRKLGIRRPHR